MTSASQTPIGFGGTLLVRVIRLKCGGQSQADGCGVAVVCQSSLNPCGVKSDLHTNKQQIEVYYFHYRMSKVIFICLLAR